MAETIGTTLVTALAGLFDKSKVTDWSATIKSALTSIGSSLLQSTLIKPLTGSIFSALGFGNLAQQFGTLSGSTSDSTNSLMGSTTSSGGIFDIFKNIGGAGKSIFDLFSGSSSSSSGGGFLSGLFGSGASAATTGGAFGLGDFGGGGAALGVSDALGLGVGAGEGLGALSGIGSALGSIIPFAGPVIGLASMFLGGLFNKKPANNVSTGGIDLSGGGSIVSNPFSSGNAQNDAQAKQITDSISSFTKNLLKETGGAISGNIDVQAGTRDGIKIGGTIGSVATGLVGVVKFADAASAISATTLAIAQHLEGVSDTMKKVLGQLTDPNQIESAIQFVNVYDKLDKAFKDSTVSVDAADAAFNSIATDAKAIGPFATAMGQITTLFQGLTDQANQFGLSLEPINFGLAEATKRLQGDFKTALDQSFNQVSGNDFLNQLNAARQTLLANQNEAGAIGLNLDTSTQDKINAIYNTTITNILKGLNVDQLAIVANDVTDSWSLADSSINSFAKSLMNGSAVVAQFGAGIQSLKDLVTNLTSGTLSGIPIGQQITAEQGIFGNELNQVNAGNFNELGNLATAGGNVVSLAQTAFGNAPQTAAIRASVLSNVNQVLSSRSFASGTDNTPPGMILVGEDGPEWMSQNGGNKIYPMGMGGMGSIEGLRAEIVRLGQIVQNGVTVNREGFSQSVNHLGKIKENTESAKALQPAQRRAS
jgi:hypothetical protein